MFAIRRGVLETNSSSVHSLTMVDADEFDKWVAGELFYDVDKGSFVPFVVSEEQFEEYVGRYITENVEVFSNGYAFEGKYYDSMEGVKKGAMESAIVLEAFVRDTGGEELRGYREFIDNQDFETFTYRFKTKNGDDVVAFGYYGFC